MDPTPITSLSVAPPETSFEPLTNRIAGAWGKFRILIIGHSGTGKSSLVNATFQASLTDVQHGRLADINREFISPHNKHLILHDSQGYGRGNAEKFDVLQRFITEYSRKEPVSERLHAIWLCIPVPFPGDRIFEADDEYIFKLYRYTVPIVVVFTKFDLYMERLQQDGLKLAEILFKKNYDQILEKLAESMACQIPYALVTTSQPETCHKLVNITMQRIVISQRIAASILVGKKRYWKTILSGIQFLRFSLRNHLYAIHKDLVTLWNIQDSNEFLSDAFCRRLAFLSGDFTSFGPQNGQDKFTLASLANTLTNGLYQRSPEYIGLLMRYVVDLTIILQAVFQLSLQDQSEGHVPLGEHVNMVLYLFLLEKKTIIHNSIREFVETQRQFVKDIVVDKMNTLIKANEMNHMLLDQKKLPFQSLFTILKFELSVQDLLRRDQIILEIVGELMQFQHYGAIISEMSDPLDVELLLDIILYLLRNDSLSNSGIRDSANRNIRRLMFELISEKDILPKSLFVTGIRIEGDVASSAIGVGGLRRVLKGQYLGHHVALKVLQTAHKTSSLRKDFCREALVWRSLAHPHILPLLGVFEENSRLFLVSPYMPNGTLTQWRKNQSSPLALEIHRLMLEVAKGVQYIHSEGIVHGSLKGENVLLDADFHCQIIDFGSARHCDTTAPGPDELTLISAAPELLGACDKCGQQDCNRCYDGSDRVRRESPWRKTTTQSDVYAFGCLYYVVFFDAIPFQGIKDDQILWLVTNGVRPDRLKRPIMGDGTWDLIQSCWTSNPSKRPAMEQIVDVLQRWVLQHTDN